MDGKGAMEYWLDEIEPLSFQTKRQYRFHFNRFVSTQGLTADQLLEMQREALSAPDTRDRRRVVLMLRNYMDGWQKDGIAPSTAKNAYKALRSFFDANDVEFTLKNREKPRADYDGQRMIQPGQIKTLYMNPGFEAERNRALIMFAKDSGLRVSDMSQLTVGHWQRAEEVRSPSGEVFKVFSALLTEKSKINAYIHVGPETLEAMNDYLRTRRDLGQDQYLFSSRKSKGMSAMALIVLFRRLCSQLGEGKKISAHSFRKFHRTMLQAAQMDDKWILILQGKASDVYARPQDSGLLTEKYIECYDKLRVLDSKTTKDYERDKELQEAKAEIARLKADAQTRADTLKADLKIDVESRIEQMKQEVMMELLELADKDEENVRNLRYRRTERLPDGSEIFLSLTPHKGFKEEDNKIHFSIFHPDGTPLTPEEIEKQKDLEKKIQTEWDKPKE